MISLLQDVPIFAGVDVAALELLMAHAQQQDYAAQAIIVREGELGNLFFVIGRGSVRVCRNFAQPGEVELVTLGPKSFFGEMCILEAMPRSATVHAVAASRLFSLPASRSEEHTCEL